jgi:hypothetical protein
MYISRPDVRLRLRLRRHLRFVFFYSIFFYFSCFVFLKFCWVASLFCAIALAFCFCSVAFCTCCLGPLVLLGCLAFLRHRAGLLFLFSSLLYVLSGSPRFVGLPRFSAPSRWPSVSVQ